MPDIEIKRGYEVLPDNNVRFGIRVTNNSDFIISDVETILDYGEDSFKLEGKMVENLGTIPPTVSRTAKFILRPLGCIHKEEIGATVRYKDHAWNKHTMDIKPKEVHCVCPFLKEKSISRADFLALTNSGYSVENGVNFENITLNKVVDFISHTCKNRLYKVDELSIENGVILYLAGDAVGEKAYYMLTAVVKEYEGLIQVFLRANSDKQHGLNGFLIEIQENLRYLVSSTEAREIGIIKKEHVINIIDSVVQRTTFGGVEGATTVNIEGSLVQRTEFNAVDGRIDDEEHLKKEHKTKETELENARGENEKQKIKSRKNIFMLAIVLGALLVGFLVLAPDLNAASDVQALSQQPEVVTADPIPEVDTAIADPIPEVTLEVVNETVDSIQELSQTSVPSFDQETYTNSVTMEFVLIPAGEFEMGSDLYLGNAENPVHQVKISKSFYMGKYEVTQMQWVELMDNNPSRFRGDDNSPVESVSWNDVQEFIKKLNEKEGTDKYRLPTEAEWEYAARAGTNTQYSFGDDESYLGKYAWYYGNSKDETVPVGQKKPNPMGLYDMHGNVYEWVQDKWHDDYNGAPTDGSAWEIGGSSYRVNRGGSINSNYKDCRSANRDSYGPNSRIGDIGFRLLMEL